MAAVAASFAGKAVATSAISYIINKAFDHLKDNKKAGGFKSTKARSGDAVEEAEDALDELEYYKLEEEVKLQDNKVGGSLHKYKGKLVQQFNHTFNTGSLKRLKSAVKTLDEAVAGVKDFVHVLNQFDKNKLKHKQEMDLKNRRETSSLPQGLVLGREISKKMVYKLSGSPLAAKVLGGLLNSKIGQWHLEQDFGIKHVSGTAVYFIKNYEFTKKELVYLWMDSGLIQHVVDDKMPEDDGIEYLDTLTKKSFLMSNQGHYIVVI
ncbi:hypothetical protein HU200_041839 [Digitaria exilis]|uniref:Disease resistance protein winged helix domain-containing protein n=1 Tax=Digitaria exilis TaxID=1010633 RepID=A0A835B739_9POAL|nr:hypothetical protein HU200_041839 [Digitaria exilis]